MTTAPAHRVVAKAEAEWLMRGVGFEAISNDSRAIKLGQSEKRRGWLRLFL